MNKISRFFLFFLTIATLWLSGCGGTAATPAAAGGGKVEPIPVAFIGVVDSVAGDQWVVNGQTVTVSPDVIWDGPFNVGDQVKVEGVVNTDGSFTVAKVEVPTPQDSSSLPQFGDDNSSDSNTNEANSNAANSNDDNGNGANTNDDNGNDANSNDDNGIDANSNDDNGNDSNSNDDNGADDNSDDGNRNDDNSSSGGGEDNGNGSNGDNDGGDDNGGNNSNGG